MFMVLLNRKHLFEHCANILSLNWQNVKIQRKSSKTTKRISTRMNTFVLYILTTSIAYVFTSKNFTCTSGQQCSSCEDSSSHCTTGCFKGFYGPRCNIKCSQGCKDSVCIAHEGGIEKCVAGCKAGLYGTRCNIQCSLNEECQKCPRECEDGFCQLDSRCVSGCEDSYYGTNCTSCGPDCEVCDRRTGTCLEDNSFTHTVYYWLLLSFGSGVCVFVMISILLLASSRIIQLLRKSGQSSRTELGQVIRLDGANDYTDTCTRASGNWRYIHGIHNEYD